jgi:hypothetical protein
MTHGYTWLRGGAVTLAVAAIIACGPGIARANEPSLLIDWSAEGRSLQLAPDGTGTLSMVHPTVESDRETWSVTWTGDASQRVTISLVSRISKSGNGLGFPAVGYRFVAALQKWSDYTVLYVDSSSSGISLMTCTLHKTQRAPLCGA